MVRERPTVRADIGRKGRKRWGVDSIIQHEVSAQWDTALLDKEHDYEHFR